MTSYSTYIIIQLDNMKNLHNILYTHLDFQTWK